MGILIRFWEDVRRWDKPTQIGFALALILAIVAGGLALGGAEAIRRPAAIAGVGLVLIAQMLVMWGNRHMVTRYTQAQRLVLAGDFEQARQELLALMSEAQTRGKKPRIDAIALLGNVYRHLGDLEQSEQVLKQALAREPEYHFPVYGLGRTYLAQGRYQEAVTFIKKSLSLGAPPVVQFDLGHAAYRYNELETARTALAEALTHEPIEPHRRLMAMYLLDKMGAEGSDIPNATLIQEGIAFWRAEAERYAQTPYGQALLEDIHGIESLATQEKQL